MGKDTSISQESYDRMTMYIVAAGQGIFIIGENQKEVFLQPDMALVVPPKTLCGMQTSEGLVYYEEGSIANMDVVSNPTMKYVLMAFDEGTGLTPHRFLPMLLSLHWKETQLSDMKIPIMN